MQTFRHKLPDALRAFHRFHEHLHTSDGVIIYKDRVVIPLSLQQDIFSTFHSAHQGTTSKMARAESSIFWAGIPSMLPAPTVSTVTFSAKRPTDTHNPASIPLSVRLL